MSGSMKTATVGIVILALILFRSCDDDEQKIKKVVSEVTTEASAGDETQGIQIQTKAMTVSRYLSPSFSGKIVLAGGQVHTTQSKQEFVSDLTATIYVTKPLVVEVSELKVTVSPGGTSAEADLEVNLRHAPTQPAFESAHFLLELKKVDGDWLIDRAEGEVHPH